VNFSNAEFCFDCGNSVLGADEFFNPTSSGSFSLRDESSGEESPLVGSALEGGVKVCCQIGSWSEPSGPIDSATEPCWMGLGIDLDVEV